MSGIADSVIEEEDLLSRNNSNYTIFDRILERRIESEGEDFIRVYSKPRDLLYKLDIEDLKQKYPLVAEDQYLEIIKDRILLLQQSTDIETRYKLMKFFAENEYGKHYPAIRNELLYRDEAELDKILCGIVNYPDDDRIRSEYGTDPDLYSAIVRYRDVCIGKGDKTLLSKEERLALVKDDRDKTLYDAKMRYMNYALKDWARRDAVDASISETEEEEIPGDQEVKNWRSVLTSIFH